MNEKILFNDNWHFHLGDIPVTIPSQKGFVYESSKTERAHAGPAAKEYRSHPVDYCRDVLLSAENWKHVTLPHDYVIEGVPSPDGNQGRGYLPYGNAWYRKTFSLEKADENKRITLLFEGVATHATVYLNGTPIVRNFCGYTEFEADLSDLLFFDRPNTVAVYVNTDEFEGWWYEGGGIYRNVWLCKTPRVSFDQYGLFVCPEKKADGEWNVKIETTLRNDTDTDEEVFVRHTLCAQTVEFSATVPFRERKTLVHTVTVKEPHLWDIDDPFMYTMNSSLQSALGNQEETVRFGFRHVEIDADRGLFLNGKKRIINGLCAHQDFGLTGKAVPDNILRYKVSLMKEMGANGFRCSHYPHPRATMDALDDMGFLVMAETRWFDSSEDSIKQLENLIKRDRNHPSVIFWSLLNEEPMVKTERGRKVVAAMVSAVKKLDSSRFITAAVSDEPQNNEIADFLDVLGVNYNYDNFDSVRERFPDKPLFFSECCATGSTRGWYFASNDQGRTNAIDHRTTKWFRSREETARFMLERPYIFGAYQWTAFEHRGECVWPRLCSLSGAIDLYAQKKDAFYQNQSHFITDRPILHLLPHWNFAGMEGLPIRVVAYTNCDEVELLHNGQSLGRVAVEKYGHAEWTVNYLPGNITAIGYKNGQEVIRDERKTSKKATALCLSIENENVFANGRDLLLLTCECVDDDGLVVPTASPFVHFLSNELGTVTATGSDNTDHVPPSSPDRQMYAGKITVAVRAGQEEGILRVFATTDGLDSAYIDFELKKD